MKTRFSLPLAFAAILSMALPTSAQLEGPPETIDYQGRVLDAVGDPVAAGTTANIEMYFRIWDDISAATEPNLVWAEKQIVTVADGNFSVRLGEGDPIEVSAGDNVIGGTDDPHDSLLGAFDGKDRFLGVSVAPNSVTKPLAEIQPRLAFLTAPFSAVAEKARFAEFGPSSGSFVADRIGVGTPNLAGSILEVDGINQLASNNGAGLISAGLLTSDHIAFDSDDIQSYSDQATPSTLKLNDHGGNVEIGSIGNQTAVEGLFSVFAGGFGGQFKVVDEGAVSNTQVIASMDAAFGVGGAQMRFEGDSLPIEIGQNSSGDFVVETNGNSQRLTVTQGGNVGIGTNAPSDKLTLGGSSSNLRLQGGDIELQARSGSPFFTNYDPGIYWTESGGSVLSQIYRWGSFSRLHISSTPGALFPGVYLANNSSSWTAYSDERLKMDIEPLTGVLDKIEDIRVVGFNTVSLHHDKESGKASIDRKRPTRKMNSGKIIKHEIGTIAQDWLEHFPELVSEPQNEDDHYGLAYDRISVVALGAAQELSAKLKEQESALKERDEKIAQLEARLAKIEALMSAAK